MLTEAVLAAIAEAVFSHLVQESGLTDRVRAVLRVDPQRRALQTALAKAYTSFAQQHPEWVAALFDETFLTGPAAPLLATLLTRRGNPAPEDLARRWCDQLGHAVAPDRLTAATRAAADFLTMLEAELADQPALQALWDARALEKIQGDVAAIRRLLEEDFRAALASFRDNVTSIIEVIERITAPVRRLPTDYATRIENFLLTYLGTPERPVPFGGRDDALRRLDAWLHDPTTPYLLLTAPAGRGKSALLARWLARLRPDPSVVFVPVSIRFGTNLASVAFASLAAQLARACGEEVPTDANTPDEVWRGICSDYLKRQPPSGRLLVVLDGVDEAANWDVDGALFPLDPLPGLKVIVSARLTVHRSRERDWLRALAWDRLDVDCLALDPLDRAGVRDVLERMGAPLDQLARQPFIVDELHRLTGGDPLLVGLYVEDLWGRGAQALQLTPEDLRTLRPGYEGYVERWFEEQRRLWGSATPLRERSVREALNLLATALGPLRADDLLALADRDAIADMKTLEKALRPLARFVIATHDGYVFSHPKLGEYFFSRLTARERRALEQRFLKWCRSVFDDLHDGRLQPQDAPPYVVRFYRAHLERADAPLADLRRLAESGAWAAAWEARDGGYGGYLSDIAAVWARAAAENRQTAAVQQRALHLGLEIRCALIEASIRALAGNLPPGLPALLVLYGVWTGRQALTYVRQMPDDEQRAAAMTALAPHLPETERSAVLRDALEAARAIGDAEDRAKALAALAPHLPPELLRDALAAARAIGDAEDRAEALAALAPHLPPELLRDALEAARAIGDAEDRAEALAALAPHLPEAEQSAVLCDALEATRAIDDAGFLAQALAALAPRLPPELLREALAAARAIGDEGSRAKALTTLAPHLPEAERSAVLREALAAARAIGDEGDRAAALDALAPHLPEVLLPNALATARAIDWEWSRAAALAALAPRLPETLLPDALAAARAIGDEDDRAKALTALAPHLPEAERSAVLREALAAARAIGDEDDRAAALDALAPHLPEALLPNALATARAIDWEWSRAKALAALAPRLPETLLPDALAAARTIEDAGARAEALGALALHLPEAKRPAVLREALEAARAIDSEWSRAAALAALALRLPEAERSAVLREALEAARAIGNEWSRAAALAALVPRLSPDLLRNALAAARAIGDEDDRADALAALAPHLPETLLPDALATARAIGDEWSRAKALTALALHLPEAKRPAVLREALEAACAIDGEWSRAKALAALAPHLPEGLLADALAAARTIDWEWSRAEALTALAPHLPETLLPDALAAARAIRYEEPRAAALGALAPRLPEAERSAVLRKALAAARALDDAEDRAAALAALVPHLPEALLPESLAAARALDDAETRAWALTALAPHLPEAERPAVLREALEAARAIDREEYRAAALAALAPHLAALPAPLRYRCLAETLPLLARRPRPQLLADLRALMPLITVICGEEAAGEMFRAMQDVARWWP
ncbi:MAG: AAA family ATPase [Planctomycetota bacterium]|nr:AAA family ATPase [Planctomycetota bacterium]